MTTIKENKYDSSSAVICKLCERCIHSLPDSNCSNCNGTGMVSIKSEYNPELLSDYHENFILCHSCIKDIPQLSCNRCKGTGIIEIKAKKHFDFVFIKSMVFKSYKYIKPFKNLRETLLLIVVLTIFSMLFSIITFVYSNIAALSLFSLIFSIITTILGIIGNIVSPNPDNVDTMIEPLK